MCVCVCMYVMVIHVTSVKVCFLLNFIDISVTIEKVCQLEDVNGSIYRHRYASLYTLLYVYTVFRTWVNPL